MFQVGDKIVHPMHGAGIVESIVQKKVNGVMRDYYVLKLPVRAMVVMIPTDNSEEIGVRPIVDREQADQVLAAIPGIEVEAQITAEYHAQVTTLPLSAITPDETVWWIADGICTEIPAQIVQTDENSAWVSLPEGISVVNGEFDRCQQGVRVRIAEGTP